MNNQLAKKLASEYVRLLGEGWEPDLEEFLGRVPQELREPCRAQIADLTRIAEECVVPDEKPESLEFTIFDEDQPEAAAEDVPEPEPEPEVTEAVVKEPEPVEPEPIEEVVAAEEPSQEPVEPEGPHRLTKEEAMAMWDSQKRDS